MLIFMTMQRIDPEDWFKVLCDNGTYVMDRYIKALNYKYKEERRRLEEKLSK